MLVMRINHSNDGIMDEHELTCICIMLVFVLAEGKYFLMCVTNGASAAQSHDEPTVPAGTAFQRHSALTDEKKR